MTTDQTIIPNLIIGAGPAGLAVAGRMRHAGIDFEILESTDKIAWSWHNHYDRLCLHTVKELSALPHLPFPDDYPRYVPREDLASYYENYAQHFDIQPHFKAIVTKVSRTDAGCWRVETKDGRVFLAERVVVATGVNRVPYSPHWNGQEQFGGEIIHSRHYKNAVPYLGKKVLLIGMGNTGAELALDLSEHDVEVTISVRSPVNIVPRDINGRPTQLTARQLAKLPFGLGDWIGTQIRKIIVGDLTKYGLQTATMSPAKQLKETGKTPVIDLGTLKYIKSGKIKIIPDVEAFTETGVLCKNGEQYEFDTVILATGYQAKVEDFVENVEGMLDRYGVPNSPIGKGEYEGLYFVGFDNYQLGGILGTINSDSKTVVQAIKEKSTG